MNASQSLATSRNDRDMQLPFQEVEDFLISYNQGTQSETLESFVHLSHHFNDRKEIETEPNLVDLGLMQQHTFYNFRLGFPKGKIKHSIGTQGSFKQNDNLETAQKFLIPDARTFESGIYYLSSLDLESVFLQGALRYDYRTVTADATSASLVTYNFILPGNPENRKLTKTFSGFTGSLGMTTKFDEKNTLKLNFSTGFRAPDLAELFSNGPHPGTSRFEKGNENFGREQSFQADANYSYRNKDFQGQISVFGSRINNYIFFASTDEIREEDGLEIWSYLQTDADFYGMEFDLKYSWLKNNRMETTISGAIVRASERGSNENISFIPPNNYNAEISYFALQDRSLFLFSKLRLIATQDRVGFNEEKTPGYVLLNLGASKKINLKENNMEIGITVYNALNKTYVDHMSILRAFNVSSPGRNLMVNLSYNF
jgi:iron complex outermembrane receptor protein